MVTVDILYSAAKYAWPDLRVKVSQAEAQGFGTAWVYDHLSGSVLSSDRMLECFTLAGALAAATSTIGIGTLVVNAANRSAGVTAAAAASVQEISGGRFVFGVGAGAAPGTHWAQEHEVLGNPLHDSMRLRHDHLAAILDLCDILWDPHRADKWTGFPLPSPRPPVLLGVNSVALARIAGARCDALNVRLDHPRIAEFFQAAQDARAQSANPSAPLELSAWTEHSQASLDPDGEAQRRIADLGGHRLILVA
ncbi:F420-dependent glucose-6-phosphate dehydrogenase [Mycobacterium simulans]|uniref:F420-dependent glucose-6-phosphate dehydrogenase n=1 Tax=Mycobacterium simulans TaxID=627089 RepID=A0A7Z7NBX0_9MYCO|nr:LLM class flavin-dependent oxidoreductase [Mycobacterium simulans]SOJ57353.1 F420-dependent glucose-6-phosphate dehydrogenase [Mycobacterium simulans]SON60636.1 F420-dependent glucose-6-phosphate dehydrogenase [Mycobacterium simulans]